MLIVALVLAVVGLAALVTAVVTSNELVAWVCIGASVIGVILLIIDAIRERQHVDKDTVAADDDQPGEAAGSGEAIDETYKNFDAEYPDDDDSGVERAAGSDDRTETFDTVSADQAVPDETPRGSRPDTIS